MKRILLGALLPVLAAATVSARPGDAGTPLPPRPDFGPVPGLAELACIPGPDATDPVRPDARDAEIELAGAGALGWQILRFFLLDDGRDALPQRPFGEAGEELDDRGGSSAYPQRELGSDASCQGRNCTAG